jgi:hypothetical protein
MTQRRPDEVMAALFAAMAEAGVEVVLLGGYAVVTWGVPRATYDVGVSSPCLLESREHQ